MAAILPLPLLLWLLLGQSAAFAQLDNDRDGVADALETALASQFLPTFFLTVSECDGRPASFQPDSKDPLALSKDGTIYVRVHPASPGPSGAARLEIQYFHLWANDCGRLGHPFDVERVSVLLASNAQGRWEALYWFASAHEDTVCDAGNGARATNVDAIAQGAQVWISKGKHASYLSADACAKGCGGDTCQPSIAMPVAAVVNIGEPGAWLNGAVWAESLKWMMMPKMKSDFDPAVQAQFDAANHTGVIPISASPAAVKAVVYGGDVTVDALGTASTHTGKALDKAEGSTNNALTKASDSTGAALKKSVTAVGNSLKKSTQAVGSAVGVKPK